MGRASSRIPLSAESIVATPNSLVTITSQCATATLTAFFLAEQSYSDGTFSIGHYRASR
jgi:hypothetical protein